MIDETPSAESQKVRLQKVLADAGVGSRRHCEELIAAGRVSVDGVPVLRQGVRVDPEQALVRVDGERVVTQQALVYLALNKPRGMVSTMADDRGRTSLADVVAGRSTRLFHVGRLDADSEGLLLLTNDGELAHRLTHPSYHVPKTYLAEVEGTPRRQALQQLRRGVDLADGPVSVDQVRVEATLGTHSMIEITVHEGRQHLVRRLLDTVGHPVVRLVRLQVGPITLGALRPGKTRRLSPQEVRELYRLVEL
ncbi:MAG: pseudouridine synthase [Mycobacteriales bacterium]